MENIFTSSDKIGDIVARFPNASEIFKKYRIDFCCGGNRALKEAIVEKELDEEKVLKELNSSYEESLQANNEEVDWRNVSSGEMIDYIVNKHHAYLNKELPALANYTAKILRAHGEHHGEMLSKVHRLFSNLKLELEEHLIKEEEVLFPAIKEYEKNPSEELLNKINANLKETENEHDAAGNIIKELRKVTNDYELPKDACATFELTYNKLKELESDLFQHIHLENNILFPRFER